MKTKYENFLQHLIYGIDEPKKTFVTHNKIGFAKDKFALKGKLLSATKIFLSDDFVNKQFVKYSAECAKKLSHHNTNINSVSDIEQLHNELFSNSLPIYDNMLILFPYSMKRNGAKEFMAGCWIQRCKPSKEFKGVRLHMPNETSTYTFTTFDNACKYHGYDERLNLSLVDYFIDFNGGLTPEMDTKAKDEFFMMAMFGNFTKQVRESYKRFVDFLPSTMHGKKFDTYKFSETLQQVDTITSSIGILTFLNLLQFINAKGSETIAFKSQLQINKRSNVIKGFEYKMLEVKKANRITTRYGDSINKNRLHQVRGHMRHYQSGKRTWIKSHQRGDEKMGVIIKDYNFK